MKKLVNGVVNFHEKVLPGLKEQFAKLSLGQSPDSLMVACSDSRVAPNLFASTDPGDLFVVRNPGNMIPALPSGSGSSEAAAVEMAIDLLKVKDIIVCGHSSCGGMKALLEGGKPDSDTQRWVASGREAKKRLDQGHIYDASLSPQDQLSQINVMVQLENLKSYASIQKSLSQQTLRLHAWWFDISTGNVLSFEPEDGRFVVIDAKQGQRILKKL